MSLPFPPTGAGNSSSSTTVSTYGTNASDAVTYTITGVSAGDSITAARLNTIITKINVERTRRGQANSSLSYAAGSSMTAADFNAISSAMNVSGPAATQAYNTDATMTVTTYPQASAPSLPADRAAGNLAYATTVQSIIDAIIAAGAVCLCNCNYCTCNCNYCTCNCNYSCTCNCNYSDRRLKRNITYLGKYLGIKVYSFQYKDSDVLYVGVMAQDLLGTAYEKAVSVVDGYYMVDYGKLPVRMMEIK